MFATKSFALKLKNDILNGLIPSFKNIEDEFTIVKEQITGVKTQLDEMNSRLAKVEDNTEKTARHVARHCIEIQEVSQRLNT